MITLTHIDASTSAVTVLELPDRMIWTDEYSWSPVVTATRWGTTGALQLHVGKRQAGRPISLEGKATQAWISRAVCNQLNELVALPGERFELLLRGQARTVVFDNSQGAAFDAEPVWKLLDGEHTPELFYRPNFKFMEV